MLNIQVYIIHSTLLTLRKEKIGELEKLLTESTRAKFTVQYITEYDPNKITQEDVSKKVSIHKQNIDDIWDILIKNVHVNQVSNSLKHAHAIDQAAASTADYCLIIEDDVLFVPNIDEQLVNVCETNNDNLVFLGLPSLTPVDGNEISFRPTSDFYKLFISCESYIAKPSTFKQLAAPLYPIKHAGNIMLSYICEKSGVKSEMITPTLFLDGSKFGVYLSAASPNTAIIFNTEYNALAQMILNKTSNDTEIEAALDAMKFRNHPDILNLQAIHLISKKEYKKAENILENIINILTQNHCIITTETEIMKTYMQLYKFLQD
jgi:hypothetical protein